MKYIYLLVILFSALTAQAQISNVSFRQDANSVVVEYSLSKDIDGIRLEVSTDGGKTFRKVVKGLSGDVGSVKAGRRAMVYDALQEVDKLQGSQVCFKVTCSYAGDSAYGNNSGYRTAAGTQTFNVKGVTFNMVYVDGGTKMASYLIGETEVTQALWQAVMGSNPSYFKGNNRPVEQISWNDCLEFLYQLKKLTGKAFRMPTEKEWEYAARGGKYSKGYQYSGSDNPNEVAWYSANSKDQTHNVAEREPNELGLYDMSGNVEEWCSDCSDSSCTRHVIRGGCWKGNVFYCRVTYRSDCAPAYGYFDLGLRLVLVP